MSRSVKSYYIPAYLDQLDFKYKIYQLNKEKILEKKVIKAERLIYTAFEKGIGIYSCPDLEMPFLELAQTLSTSQNVQFEGGSFLHVLTKAYVVGGHTRVLERWIDLAPKNQKHSIVLLNQENVLYPEKLSDLVYEHGGDLFIFNEESIIQRALRLRELASNYEFVLLHVHMFDPTPIIAFGTKDFKRPVILFNHADHSYWCGATIVDALADLRVNEVAHKYRGIKHVFPVRIPFEKNESIKNFITKVESRKLLGLPLNKKIILTVGSPHKYQPFAGYEFCEIIAKTISTMNDVVCYGIGPNNDIGGWSSYGEQFIALGNITYGEEYFHYLNACDVYVNSIPISGGTAMLDAIQFKKPVLSFNLFDDGLGNIIEGVESIFDLKVFNTTLKKLLLSNEMIQSLAQRQYETVLEYHGIENWCKNVEDMFCHIPIQHSINMKIKPRYKINDMAVMVSLWNGNISGRKTCVHDVYHFIKRMFQ